jgi:protein-disulfide isomerase/rhodanese-related sulfurtransferase
MRKHLLLALSLLGLFDALYLLWVYTSPSRPIVCLGSGCEAVRASSYAHLFGLPLPVFGVANYAVLALLILAEDLFSAPLGRMLQYAVLALSGFGFLFSLYLTSLEAFVIHSWCAWCVVSALVVTGIFVLSLFELPRPPAPAEPVEAIASVRTNFVLCVLALVVGVPAFILLSQHGALADAPEASSKALAEHLVRPDSHMTGNSSAPLTVVEFGDFECPGCGLSEEAASQIRAQFGDRIRFIFRQFPINKIHPLAEKAAEASECAAEQGKFWEAVEKLYAKQTDLSVDALKRYAGELGLDQSRFNQCLDSGQTVSRVKQDLADGRALGVQGTPTFFIGRKVIFRPLDYATFSLLVNQELANPAPTTAGASSSPSSSPAQLSSSNSKSPPSAPTGETAPAASAGSGDVFGSNPASFVGGSQTALGGCSEAEANKQQPTLIGTAQVRQLLEAGPGPVLVDVRPAKEYAGGRIPGALNVPLEDFAQDSSKLPKDKTIVLYESGHSSGNDVCAASRAAGRALLERGFSFEKVKVYQDGLAGWQKAGQPVQH